MHKNIQLRYNVGAAKNEKVSKNGIVRSLIKIVTCPPYGS